MSTGKRSVGKADLARFDPDESFVLDGKGLAVLHSWLGSRYNRTAFADAFVNCMRATKADSRLSEVMEKHGVLISFV